MIQAIQLKQTLVVPGTGQNTARPATKDGYVFKDDPKNRCVAMALRGRHLGRVPYEAIHFIWEEQTKAKTEAPQ